MLFPRSLSVYFGRLLALACLFFCSLAQAQVLDRIDVIQRDNEADIVVRFAQKILYQRHAPQNEGKNLRIFVRLVDSNLIESDLMQETVRSQKTERIPGVTALYPELVNGMLVTFSQSTRYAIHPGDDGRSIIITVPLLPAPEPVVKPESAKAAPVTPEVPAKAEPVSKAKPEPAAKAKPGKEAPAPRASAPLPVIAVEPTPAVPPVVAAQSPAETAPPAPAPLAREAEPLAAPAPVAGGAAPVSAPAAAPVAAPTLSAAEVENLVRGFMSEARRALDNKDAPTAINRLNRILGMPPSSQTEPAQALIGEAREQNGELLKAKAEYELYLKLFPAGPNLARVKDRLAKLPKEAAIARNAAKPLPKEAGPAEWTYFGSVSAYYYTGKSQIETLTPPAPGQLTFNRESLSAVDQNSLITSINLNARRRDAFTDTRIVVRDTDNHNYLRPDRSYNRLYAAYVDHTDRRLGYYVRAGRQNPNGMGVLERFDGIQAGYSLSGDWRVNAVYGDAVEFGSPFKKSFYGMSVDFMPQTGRPGVSLYGIEQTLDGMKNRRALGGELRYFDGKASGYGMLDYDLLYQGVNIALLQGNYIDDRGNNYFLVIDHRRAPSYSLTNALPGAQGLTLKELVAAQGLDLVREQAKALTATSDMFSIGVTHPFNEQWQFGADYRMSEISATKPVQAVLPLAVIGTCLGTIDPVNNTCIIDTASQQGSGKNHVVTLQAIGNSLFVKNAVGSANLSLIQAPTYQGQAWAASYMLPFAEQWRLDTNFRYYTQKDNDGGTQNRTSPSLKLSWQWQNSVYLEGEVGREVSNANGPSRTDHTKRDYLYMGLRWDFR